MNSFSTALRRDNIIIRLIRSALCISKASAPDTNDERIDGTQVVETRESTPSGSGGSTDGNHPPEPEDSSKHEKYPQEEEDKTSPEDKVSSDGDNMRSESASLASANEADSSNGEVVQLPDEQEEDDQVLSRMKEVSSRDLLVWAREILFLFLACFLVVSIAHIVVDSKASDAVFTTFRILVETVVLAIVFHFFRRRDKSRRDQD